MEPFSPGNIYLEYWLPLVILIIFVAFSKFRNQKKYKLPPGPLGFPIVGYLPLLSKAPYLKFIELAKKYGDVFSVHLGSRRVVILNSGETVREAFGKRELLARPPESPFVMFGLQTPFFTPNFHMWQEQRRFVVHSMKDLGLGKSKIEGHLQEEILYFMKLLKAADGQPVDLLKNLTPSMSNNIGALVFGERHQYDDLDRVQMDSFLNVASKAIGQTQVFLFYPFLRKIPLLTRFMGYRKALEGFRWMMNYVDEKVQKHRETLDPKNVRDFIDSYLIEMKIKKENNEETTLSEPTMQGCIMALFNAGSETVRNSISWIMYIMACFPEVQTKVRKEILDVIGPERLPEYPDHQNMPYTQAVTREIMRWKTIVPLNVMRYALDDVKIGRYDVPKGTIVLANFWAVHHDPRCWKDPDAFRPERFLDAEGKLVKNNNLMPFSVGKRSCPGENMALMEIFLYFTSILQRFRVSFPKGVKPDFGIDYGLIYTLKPHKLCFLGLDEGFSQKTLNSGS